MNDFPFSTFLALLSTDGIHLSIHDYERMQRAFAAGGIWTIVRLKNVLIALLAKDNDQQRQIGRKFDLFFSAETQKDKLPPEIDVRKLILDLRSMPSTSQPPQEPDPLGVETSDVVPKVKPPSPRIPKPDPHRGIQGGRESSAVLRSV